MNLTDLQAELRHFAAERDWQPFHTPKNLSTALLVEAAELAEIFQWMTPEQSQVANLDPDTKGRIADEVADVLLYLLQVADHCQVDLAEATAQKVARNAKKYPPVRRISRESSTNVSLPGVHVLVDYENVQPSVEALRALVADASQFWVFHGPHQRHVAQSFAGLGDAVTAVPISKTGKDALDFHLSFYVGYIASRNPLAQLVVVANDKGYEPMLAHARELGFSARQLGHVKPKKMAGKQAGGEAVAFVLEREAGQKAAGRKTAVRKTAAPAPAPQEVAVKKRSTRTTATKAAAAPTAAAQPAPQKATKAAAKKAVAAPPAEARKPPAAKSAPPARKAAAKKAAPPAKAPAKKTAPPAQALPEGPDARTTRRLVEGLRKMGEARPTKAKSLWRTLSSFLGADATEDDVERALSGLIARGIVKVNSVTGVSYPSFTEDVAGRGA